MALFKNFDSLRIAQDRSFVSDKLLLVSSRPTRGALEQNEI